MRNPATISAIRSSGTGITFLTTSNVIWKGDSPMARGVNFSAHLLTGVDNSTRSLVRSDSTNAAAPVGSAPKPRT